MGDFVHLCSQSWGATCAKFGEDIGAPMHVLGGCDMLLRFEKYRVPQDGLGPKIEAKLVLFDPCKIMEGVAKISKSTFTSLAV